MAVVLDFGGSNLAGHAAAIESLLDHTFNGVKVVSRVGLGFKLQGVAVKQPLEWAYRVHVAWQGTAVAIADQIAASNAAFDSIPPQVGGVATDVFFEVKALDLGCAAELAPGKKLTPRAAGSEREEGFGSIGLLVMKGGAPHLLTAAHVLGKTGTVDPDPLEVFVPEPTASLCTRPVAARPVNADLHHLFLETATSTVFVTIDCGLAKLEPEIEYTGTPEETGGPVLPVLRNLFLDAQPQPPPAPIAVWKMGARTGLTHGTVVELLHVDRFKRTFWLARVQPTEGWDEERRIYVAKSGPSAPEIDKLVAQFRNRSTTLTRAGETKTSEVIEVKGPSFSWQGDSGAAVYDSAGNLLGLVKGGEGMTIFDASESEAGVLGNQPIEIEPSTFSYIGPAFTRLGLLQTDIVTSGGTAAGARVAVPGARVIRPARRWREGDLEAALEQSPAGQELLALGRRYSAELVELVHHRRRVTVAWHRGKAAAFAAAVLSLLDGGRSQLPATIDGVSAGQALRTLFAALATEADLALRADLERHGGWIAAAADGVTDVSQLRDRLAEVTFEGRQGTRTTSTGLLPSPMTR